MAPQLRSASRANSQNPSRPATPQETPATVSSASGTEPTRPRKQRKTGRNARVAVDPVVEAGPSGEASGSGAEQQNNADMMDLQEDYDPNQPPKTGWDEPTMPALKPSTKETPKNPFDGAPITRDMMPLGVKPPKRLLARAAKAREEALSAPHPLFKNKGKGKKRSLEETDTTENGDERPKTATSSVEGPGQTDSSRAEGSAGPLGREERVTRSTRSKTGNENLAEEAPATVNGHGPAVPSVPTSRSRDRISEIVEAAIAEAEGRNDSVVSRGLRRIWDDSVTDPFLLTVLDAVLNHNADPQQRAVFQTVMRDTSKKIQAEDQAGEPMARTQSGTSSSSLSSAKSLDPETFAPAIAGPANTNPRAKGKAAKAAASKAKGKGRAGPSRARSVTPTTDVSLTRKRSVEVVSGPSEDELAAKRMRLERSFEDATVEESDERTRVGPHPDAELPVPSPHEVERWEMEREASGAGIDLGLDASSPNLDGVRPAPQMVDAAAARSPEIDNIDFCRVCTGNGQLLCCDGCVDSFHFSCLEPPVNSDFPPEGQWFCPSCAVRGPFGVLIEEMGRIEPALFSLPAPLRNRFEGVGTDEAGRYQEEFVPRPESSRTKVTRASAQEMRDSKGRLIVCFRCRQTSDYGRRPVIQCDYCPCSWHLDCLDPPLANPPYQRFASEKKPKAGESVPVRETWRCPNHIEHDLAPVASHGGRVGRARRVRDPQIADVDVVLQDREDESFLEQDTQGTLYRVSEHGIILNFIDRVHRDAAVRAQRAQVKSLTDRQNAEDLAASDRSNQDAFATPGPSNVGAAPANAAPAALSSRPASADYEAAMNLMALSQPNQDVEPTSERVGNLIQQMTEVEQLQSLQEQINRRIQALNSGAVPSDN